MPEKTKDGPKARNDLIKLGIRKELHGGCPDDADDDETQADTQGHMYKKAKRNDYYCPPSCFTLSEPELHQFSTSSSESSFLPVREGRYHDT
jgi:hypothetical protein